jgi:polyisoprenoid-binding protein YceI
MVKSSALVLALGLCAAAPALAQTPPTREPAEIPAGTYAVDPAHTQVLFAVSHMGFSTFTGVFSEASGTLALDPKTASASALKVSVPVASVLTTSPKLNEELKSAQWLDAARFPAMTFSSTKVVTESKDKAKVTGDLTLHGVTKPVTLDVTLVGSGVNPLDKKVTVGFEAKGDIKRSDFGVKTYVPLIGDMLHLSIAGAFEKQD